MLHWIKKHAILLCILAALLFPAAVNLFMYVPLPTQNALKAPDWLDFWGSYLGSFLGCIPALLALHESRRQGRQQHEESMEARRCSLIPIVDLSLFDLREYPDGKARSKYFAYLKEIDASCSTVFPEEFTKEAYNRDPHRFFDFYVRNIGPGPALQATVSLPDRHGEYREIFTGDVSPALDLHLIFEAIPVLPTVLPTFQRTLHFDIEYFDVFQNKYKRTLSVTIDSEGILTSDWTAPQLVERK